MSKHTPGPWEIDTDNGRDGGIAIGAADPKDGQLFEVATIWGEDSSSAQTPMAQANARLIAAAPDLLEFALAVSQFDGRNNTTHIKQWAAELVKKARGEA